MSLMDTIKGLLGMGGNTQSDTTSGMDSGMETPPANMTPDAGTPMGGDSMPAPEMPQSPDSGQMN